MPKRKKPSKSKSRYPKNPVAKKKFKNKMTRVMREYEAGILRTGSTNGPVVQSRKQAIAIALSEARKEARL